MVYFLNKRKKNRNSLEFYGDDTQQNIQIFTATLEKQEKIANIIEIFKIPKCYETQ